MNDLADAIEADATALASRTVAAMYEDPFWQARFGERGRRFAEEDGRHHVGYLVEALRAGRPDVLTGYARWLQGVLTSRGMCSRHLADHFARLGDALAARGLGDARATDYLAAARAALAYAEGPARAVQQAADALARRATDALHARHPDGLARGGEGGRAHWRDDLAHHASYLADALALGRPAVFADHVRWAGGFLAQRGVPRAHLAEALAEFDRSLDELSPDAAAAAREVVAAGRRALDATP